MELKEKVKRFPDAPGVYLMKDAGGKVVYVGKATSLRERALSYFANHLPVKTVRQMEKVADIEFQETESALEAIFEESKLIKKFNPKYNIAQKDDKSRAYVYFTSEDFPRVCVIRETELASISEKKPAFFGPFQSTAALNQALELIREIVPFRTCRRLPRKRCLYGFLGLCEMPCEGKISQEDYRLRIRQARDFFEGRKARVLSSLKREMGHAAKAREFEEAARVRDRIFALEHLREVFAIKENLPESDFNRIEGYDISNISGAYATGSMVVFVRGQSEKSEYRKFKIKSVASSDDIAMLKEVLRRRFKKTLPSGGWSLPDLILVDGGEGQVGAAVEVLGEAGLDIPVVGLAKGPDRKQDRVITSRSLPRRDIRLFKAVRDEAHRFAKGYYEKLHRKSLNF